MLPGLRGEDFFPRSHLRIKVLVLLMLLSGIVPRNQRGSRTYKNTVIRVTELLAGPTDAAKRKHDFQLCELPPKLSC